MMAEGGDFVDESSGRNDLGWHGEGNEEKERPSSQHLGAEEREGGFLMTRGNGGGSKVDVNHGHFRLRTLEQFNDRSLSMRDPDATSSKFQWTNFLPGSRNLKVDGMKEDFLYDSRGRKYVRVDEKSVPTESDRIRNSPSNGPYVQDVGIPEYNRLTRNLSGPLLRDSNDFQVREYPPHQAREMSRRCFDEGSCPRFCSRDSSPCLTPRSQSSGQHASPRGIPMHTLQSLHQQIRFPADVQPARYDNTQQVPCSTAGLNVHLFQSKAANYPEALYHPNVCRPGDYIHQESQWFGGPDPIALPDYSYDRVQNVQNYNDQGDISENDAFGHTLQTHVAVRNSHRCVLRKDELQSSHDAFQGAPALDNYDVRRHTNVAQYEKVVPVPRNTYHECGIDAIETREVLFEKTNSHDICCEERKYYVIGQQGGVCITDEDIQQGLELGEFGFSEQYNRMPKRKHRFVETTSQTKRRGTTTGSRLAPSHDNVQLSAEPKKKYIPIRSFSHHGELQTRENIEVSKTDSGSPFGGLSEALQSRLSKPCEAGGEHIRKRLKVPHIVPHPYQPKHLKSWRKHPKYTKPCPHGFNVIPTPQPHDITKGTKFKKRLKPAPTQDPKVSYPGPNMEKQHKLSMEKSGSAKEACHSQEADLDDLKLKAKPAEKDLPEHSEEFKKQVHEWFLKSMQLLNANPGRQKRFKEQGKAGSLKCFICSSSKEFMDTKDIAMHAFSSLKVGFRAHHLGFHRALCVLMGWDSALAPNSRWVCRSLPDIEAWALKDDTIIWPPVVIIHNSYAGSFHPNDQVKNSIERLESILRDEGFDGGKTKVCKGKAGNPNIKVVKFSGTLSGLQEAERLHYFFAKRKHGRNELLRATTAEVSCREDAQMPLDDAVGALYGYLGILEDLDKLHYDMKRYCCAKSKKEVLAFADPSTR